MKKQDKPVMTQAGVASSAPSRPVEKVHTKAFFHETHCHKIIQRDIIQSISSVCQEKNEFFHNPDIYGKSANRAESNSKKHLVDGRSEIFEPGTVNCAPGTLFGNVKNFVSAAKME
jgi:hypothetical protein